MIASLRLLAVLLLVAVLALLVIGVAAARTRRRFCSAGPAEAFRCKVRLPRGADAGSRQRWPRWRAEAMWVHDVLLVQCGLLFPRTTAFAVRLPEDVIREAGADEVRGLGHRPVVISLRLDDGPLVEVAAASPDRTPLAGPFLAAAIPGLPRGRSERRNLGR